MNQSAILRVRIMIFLVAIRVVRAGPNSILPGHLPSFHP